MATGMERQKEEVEDIYDRAIEAILNTRFNAPGWPLWIAFEDLPEGEDEGKKGKKKKG